MSQTIEIESIARLDIKPGETLVVRLPIGTTREIVHEARQAITQHLPEGVEVLITTSDVELTVVAREDT